MDAQYRKYAESRLGGNFSEMSSWKFVYPYLKDKRVLDIGCSDGLYLRHLSKDSVGIEQVSVLAKAGSKNGLEIINDDVFHALGDIDNSAFDGVLFSHVMEHVDCPIGMLREIYRTLKPNGVLVLGLPIERNIYRDLLRMDYFNGTHIYAFSIRNAEKLLQETGFMVEKIFYHLPKCRSRIGGIIEKYWNEIRWPFREYLSMAYWIIAIKLTDDVNK